MNRKLIRKVLSVLLTFSMFFSVLGFYNNIVTAEPEVVEKDGNTEVNLETTTVYMTLDKEFTEVFKLNPDIKIDDVKWTYDGKPIEEVKTWSLNPSDGGGFTGDQFIKVTQTKDDDGTTNILFNIKSLFGRDLSERAKFGNIRREYPKHIGIHNIVGTNDDGSVVINKTINLRPYYGYRSYDEMVDEVNELAQNHADNRVINLETIGTSAQGRDIRMAVIAKDQNVIDDYLNRVNPRMLNEPDKVLEELKAGTFEYHIPIFFNNTHADEQPGIDIVTNLFISLSQGDIINYPSVDKDGQDINIQLNVQDLLDRFIFIFDFTENPDGYFENTRTLANGMDPNRDAGYQTNPETRAIVRQINRWNPISLLDFHGFVKGFLIEPCTPPHDPNFEYDLFIDTLLEEAHTMGRAGITNSEYNQYTIPKIDWGAGWDDFFSGYTGVYSLYQGILGHTVEIPEGNVESLKAGIYAGYANINYVNENLEMLMERKLNFYSRGINKVESQEAENQLIDPDGNIVGRNKGDNSKFFPDYYVIPMTANDRIDMQAAFDMVEYFERNGVVVKELKEDVGEYKKGDLVVDMAQAKRGYANHVLYEGEDVSVWSEMYAEIVMDFPRMRGFESHAIYKDGLFSGKLGDVTRTEADRSVADTSAPYYFVSNSSATTLKAVNKAIADGEKVYLYEDGFIMETSVFAKLLENYAIYGEPIFDKKLSEDSKPIEHKKIYMPTLYYWWAGDFAIEAGTKNALAPYGFEFVNDIDEADIIILEDDQFEKDIIGRKPTVIVGGTAIEHLTEIKGIDGFISKYLEGGAYDGIGASYEGLMTAEFNKDSQLTSGYKKSDLIYSNSGSWIEGIPEGFKTIVTLGSGDHFLAGWWPGHEQVKDKVMAIDGMVNNQPTYIIAANPTNKKHNSYFYRWISNAIYRGELATLEDVEKPNETPNPALPDTGSDYSMVLVSGTVLLAAGAIVLAKYRKNEEK